MKWKNQYISKRENTRSGWKLKKVKGIVVHYTASSGDTAAGEAKYFGNGAEGRHASAHMFVDEKEAICIIPLDEVAFHANESGKSKISKLNGSTDEFPNGNANIYTIGVEMCTMKGKLDVSEKVEKNTVDIVAQLLNKFDLSADDIYRHYDITGKDCPKPFVSDTDRWKEFKKKVAKKTKNAGSGTEDDDEDDDSEDSSESVEEPEETPEELKARRKKEHEERDRLRAEAKELRKKKREEFIKLTEKYNWDKDRLNKSLDYIDKLEALEEEAIKRADFFQDFKMPGFKKLVAKAKENDGDEDEGGDSDSEYKGEVDLSEVDFSPVPEGKKRKFVKSIADAAIMGYKEFDILPSVMFGQGALESGWGDKHINNALFGIKATGSTNQWWKGNKKTTSTKEDYGSGLVSVKQGFRTYDSIYDSCMDFARMLGTASHYSKVPGERNPKKALQAIKAGGYATDKDYVYKVYDTVIKPNNLTFLDDPKYKKLAEGGKTKSSKEGSGKAGKIKSKAEKLLKAKDKMTAKDFINECLDAGIGKTFSSISSILSNDTKLKDVKISNIKAGDIVVFSLSEKADVAGVCLSSDEAIICKNKKAPQKVDISSGEYKKKMASKAKRVKA